MSKQEKAKGEWVHDLRFFDVLAPFRGCFYTCVDYVADLSRYRT